MNKPPPTIDGATVLYWAWSGNTPFGRVGDESDPEATAIFGLAIARYEGDSRTYRFSCDRNWEVEQDGVCESVDEAINQLPVQYRRVTAKWHKY
jgi:hypothetical protein